LTDEIHGKTRVNQMIGNVVDACRTGTGQWATYMAKLGLAR